MFLNKSFDKKTGIYRTKDNIDSFRFRITLKTLHSFVKVPKFNAEQLNDAEDLDEIEFYNFQWQQKVFSSAEIKLYSDLENCKNDRTKEYHKRITEVNRYLDENGAVCYTGKIFSYINEDNYHERDSERNELAECIERYGQWENNSEFVGDFFPEDANVDEIQRARFKNLGQFECMYIMADLKKEILLFSIKYRSSDGLLLIYPDLNNIDANPYLKEIVFDSRNLYQFAMENLSMDCQNEVVQLKNDIELLANKYATVCLYFEIQMAENFEYDAIHIKYEIHLPDDCQTIDGMSQLKGCTHSSRRDAIDGCWLIGYCHELTLSCRLDCLRKETIKIAYEVISIDSWSRERSEGYAVYSVPLLAGSFVEKIDCYRDLGDNTWLNWIERYFIGGRRKVQINNFHGITANNTKNALNRYGNCTQSTGQLSIRRNVVIQRNIDEIDGGNFERNQSVRRSQKLPTISSVLLAYHRAREKLESIADINDF
ncbi:tectonic-like complex member Mks1 isoform X2 [Sitodiplosis mosellana]|uniref:tectonic-like complex member Mks1 isoform X2 n=1 Tax=Sitodiplosis mosellana TaxID=263140 RepID=UPI0024443776|nr:tectonic-like complex member Mks1 isoform X2 [Sitodiplosis mosellana]